MFDIAMSWGYGQPIISGRENDGGENGSGGKNGDEYGGRVEVRKAGELKYSAGA